LDCLAFDVWGFFLEFPASQQGSESGTMHRNFSSMCLLIAAVSSKRQGSASTVHAMHLFIDM